jgi:predicted transcriptional regulator
MTKPKPKSELKINRNSRELIYTIINNAKREVPMVEVRHQDLTQSTVETALRQLATDGTLIRRQVRDKPKGRAFWVYRLPDTEMNPAYVDADHPSVVSALKSRKPAKEKTPPSPDFKKIMKEEPDNYRTLRDLPKGSEQVVSELYLADYYDTSSPKFLKDHRPMKDTLTPDASSNIVQIIRDAAELQKVTAFPPPNWAAINSLAQSILISSAGLMRDSLSNIWSEHDRK